VPPTVLVVEARLTELPPLPALMVMAPVTANELPPVLKLSEPAAQVTVSLPPMELLLPGADGGAGVAIAIEDGHVSHDGEGSAADR